MDSRDITIESLNSMYSNRISKNSIRNYLSGKAIRKDKLEILCEVLEVNHYWLSGYDVPQSSDSVPNSLKN